MRAKPPIAVLAGGLATRLGELTRDLPKSLLDVHGRPFLAWQLELFAAQGLTDVVLCTGHFSEQIEAWLAANPTPGLRVRVSRDGPRQLGTGGALQQALPWLGDAFLVAYGDSYLRCDYLAVFGAFERASASARALMTVYRNENRYDVSNVVFREGRIVRYDKRERSPAMQHIDWGLGVVTAEALAAFPVGEPLDLADVYGALVGRGQLAGFEVDQRFFEVGSHAGLDEFRDYVEQSGAAHGARG